MSAPLEGVLVLDLSRAVAGPMCTMMLADLGARVLKIEEESGDEARRWGPPFVGAESTYFLGFNRNKESGVFNLKKPEDLAVVREIGRRADIVVENYRPGVAQRLGVGYDALRRENPGLIYGSVSGFGQEGPERDRPGYDLIVQAATGLMHTTGEKVSFPIADVLAALNLEQAILAALLRRGKTGEGAYLDTTLTGGLLAAMSPLTTAWLMAGVDSGPVGHTHANIVPYQVFSCRDGALTVGVTNERIWGRFCTILGQSTWITDPRYAGNENRNQNRAALQQELEPIFLTRTAHEWEALLREGEVPAAAVHTVGEAAERYGGAWTLENGIRVPGNPVHIQGLTPRLGKVPALGEHTVRLREEFAPAG